MRDAPLLDTSVTTVILVLMNTTGIFFCRSALFVSLALLASATRAEDGPLREGASIDLGGRTATILQLHSLPFVNSEYNAAFVLMQYFGYLRRDPDQGGYNFWLGIVNSPSLSNYRSMVCAFLTSAEYQLRFSSHVPRNDTECSSIN